MYSIYFKLKVKILILAKKLYSKEQEQEIINKYLSGMTTKELGLLYGCRYETICKLLRTKGISNKNGRSYDLEFEKKVLKLYQDGNSMKTIGDTFGYSAGSILNILIRNGYDKKENLLTDKVLEVKEKYNSGKTLLEVSKEYDCSPQTVQRILVKNDVEIRDLKILTQDQEIEICELYVLGLYPSEICIEYDCSEGLIYKVLHRNGINIKDESLTDLEQNEIIKKYVLGDSLNKLSCEYKRSIETIKKLLVNNNIQQRTLSESNKVYDFNYKYFDDTTKRSVCYHLGWMFSDGNVYNNSIYLGLQDSDRIILDTYRKYLETNKELEWRDSYEFKSLDKNINKIYISKPTYLFRITNEYIANRLKELGCVPKKSLVLKYPTKGMIPENRHVDFIRGYFEGDGSVCFNSTSVKYGNYSVRVGMMGTFEFLSEVKIVLHKLGIKTIGISQPRKYLDKNTWDLAICNMLDVLKFKESIYDNYLKEDPSGDLILHRKYNIFLEIQKYVENHPELLPKLERNRVLQKQDSIENIIDLYVNQKVSIKEIAKKYNVSTTTICNRLTENNISVESNKKTSEYIKENISEIIKLYEQGVSQRKIAKLYNVDKTVIGTHLKKQDVKTV